MFDIIKSFIFGHAVGDALGVPVEFLEREYLSGNPVTDMIGFGTHNKPAGTWSDDTSMTLATLDSLSCGIDYNDIMEKFCEWYKNNKYTATGVLFDIGTTTQHALSSYITGINPLQCGCNRESDNGNGSLMRIIPAALYAEYYMENSSADEKILFIHNISALTHAHDRSKVGCGIYAFIVWELIKENSKDSILRGLDKAKEYYSQKQEYRNSLDCYNRIYDSKFSTFPEKLISSSGYIVHTLEAAIWCILTTNSYSECVLKAVNLGSDTDTVAAVAGGLAGALYGYSGIPEKWIATLKKQSFIDDICKQFSAGNQNHIDNNETHRVFDIHSHVLFGIDDGSEDINMSLEMLKQAYTQGVRDVVCSSHHAFIDNRKYDENLRELIQAMEKEGISINLHPGTEIACDKYSLTNTIDGIINGDIKSVSNSNYLLLEFSTEIDANSLYECITEIINRTGKKIIIAHIERYIKLSKESKVLDKLKKSGVLFQINAYSLSEEKDFYIRSFARELLDKQLVDFIGSDAHKITHRPYSIKQGVDFIYANCDTDYADQICYNNALTMIGYHTALQKLLKYNYISDTAPIKIDQIGKDIYFRWISLLSALYDSVSLKLKKLYSGKSFFDDTPALNEPNASQTFSEICDFIGEVNGSKIGDTKDMITTIISIYDGLKTTNDKSQFFAEFENYIGRTILSLEIKPKKVLADEYREYIKVRKYKKKIKEISKSKTINIPQFAIRINDNTINISFDKVPPYFIQKELINNLWNWNQDMLCWQNTITCENIKYACELCNEHLHKSKHQAIRNQYGISSGRCGENACWNYFPDISTLQILGSGDIEGYDHGEEHKSPWWDFRKSIKRIEFVGHINTIGQRAFFNFTDLTVLDIPVGIKKIEKNAFAHCGKLETINLSDGLEVIESEAFRDCCSVKQICIPCSVKDLDVSAFKDWKSDQRITHLKKDVNGRITEEIISTQAESKAVSFADFVVLSDTNKCTNANHTIKDVTAEFTIINKQGTITYEQCPAGYCNECNRFFIHKWRLERMKSKGIILCQIVNNTIFSSSKASNYFANLSPESILKQSGYTVNATDNLSSVQRRTVLICLIENRICPKHKIISHLSWLIKLNEDKTGFENAVSLWSSDRKFVEEYKLGTSEIVRVKSLFVNNYRKKF